MYHPPKHVMQLPVSQLPEPVYKPPESLELLQMRIKDYMIAGRNDKAQEVACKVGYCLATALLHSSVSYTYMTFHFNMRTALSFEFTKETTAYNLS